MRWERVFIARCCVLRGGYTFQVTTRLFVTVTTVESSNFHPFRIPNGHYRSHHLVSLSCTPRAYVSSHPSSPYPQPDCIQVSTTSMSNFQLPAGFRPSAPPSSSAGPSSGGGSGQGAEEQAAARERAAAQEEMKRGMISAMLEPEARERCELPSLEVCTFAHVSVEDIFD